MFTRYEGSAFEKRFLPRLTFKEVEQLPKDNALVVLSIGAVEQHGYHLPLMTDALIGEAALVDALEQLPEDVPVWMIPPLSYGKSNEHIGFAGTLSLSSFTLQHVVMDIAKSLHASGFRKLLLFNTHGGNIDLLNLVAREIRIATGMTVFYLAPYQLDDFSDMLTAEEVKFGLHGGDYETSIVKSIKPDWVHDNLAVREIPDMSSYQYLTIEDSIRFAWITSDISKSGVLGDATTASLEKGNSIRERITKYLVQALEELCTFNVTDVKTQS